MVKEDEKPKEEIQSPEVQLNESKLGDEEESKGGKTKKVVKKVVKKGNKELDKVISTK